MPRRTVVSSLKDRLVIIWTHGRTCGDELAAQNERGYSNAEGGLRIAHYGNGSIMSKMIRMKSLHALQESASAL